MYKDNVMIINFQNCVQKENIRLPNVLFYVSKVYVNIYFNKQKFLIFFFRLQFLIKINCNDSNCDVSAKQFINCSNF